MKQLLILSAGILASWAVVAAPIAVRAADKPADDPKALEAAAAQLDALDKRVTRLEDANAIEKLQRSYGYFVDKAQWTQLTELFAKDATLEIGGRGVFIGKPLDIPEPADSVLGRE